MLTEQLVTPPTLEAPGKGLPKIELFIARILVGLKAKRTSRSQAAIYFDEQKQLILKLLKTVEPQVAAKQVLIKRLRGLEDSSRYWSLYMTVEHLRIVNQGILEIILALNSGKHPSRVVSTADVKPSPSVGSEVLQSFGEICEKFQQQVGEIPDLKTTLTWAHPWFGELNAEKWHFVASFHMGLHYQQILAIKQKLTL